MMSFSRSRTQEIFLAVFLTAVFLNETISRENYRQFELLDPTVAFWTTRRCASWTLCSAPLIVIWQNQRAYQTQEPTRRDP
jgi:hypothetical protein